MFQKTMIRQFLATLSQIRCGSLTLTTPDGQARHFGGDQPGPAADLTLLDWRTVPAIAAKADIGMTEAYRDGWWETNDLEALLTLALMNEAELDRYMYGSRLQATVTRLLYLFNRNSRAGARRNISAHYDLGNDFYRLWLDPTMTYSSALFQGTEDLAQAQLNKYDRIIDHLAGASGRLLEIGCGWGGFAERALARGDFAAKALTLSERQAEYARERLGHGAEIALQDYRDETGRFDHIVSIEMFEAVGERYWPQYFGKLSQVLSRRGQAMIQTITVADRYFDRYRKGGDMIRSFIFPGGMLPSPGRFEEQARRAGLAVADRFTFGQDYARTLRAWLVRFDEALPQVRALGFDDRFIRVWRFYLAACAASFTVGRTDVAQYQLAHAPA